MRSYPILMKLKLATRWLAWVGLGLAAFQILAPYFIRSERFLDDNLLYAFIIAIGRGFSTAVTSMFVYVLSEAIQLFVDIQDNTYLAAYNTSKLEEPTP